MEFSTITLPQIAPARNLPGYTCRTAPGGPEWARHFDELLSIYALAQLRGHHLIAAALADLIHAHWRAAEEYAAAERRAV